MYLWRYLTDVGNLIFLRKSSVLSSSGAKPFVVMLLPRKSICGWPNAPFAINSFSPTFWICWNTASMFDSSSSTVWRAIPMSSTNCARLSAFTGASTYSRTVLLNADRDRLSPCASCRKQMFGYQS